MASRLGPMWLNKVRQVAAPDARRPVRPVCRSGPTRSTRWSRASRRRPTPSSPRGRRQLRLKARQGDSLNTLLVETFALVREAAKRTIKQRHYDVQLVGGAAIHCRSIAEMETGEGKTLVATLPAVLNALPGKGVHVVTVNDYLAQPRRRVDDARLQAPRLDRRLHPDRPAGRPEAAPPTPATSPTARARNSASTSSATS